MHSNRAQFGLALALHFPPGTMSEAPKELVVVVGTTNPTKVTAVKNVLARVFPHYTQFNVQGVSVRSSVSFGFESRLLDVLMREICTSFVYLGAFRCFRPAYDRRGDNSGC